MGLAVEVSLPTVDEIGSFVGRQHDDALWELELVRRRVEAAISDVIDHADRSGHFAADGHRNSAAWVRAVTNCSPAESRARIRTVRALRALPATRDALHAGTVGVDQVRELARVHANRRCAALLPESETILLNAARELQYADYAIVTRRWETLADQDGAHRDHAAADDARDFTIVEHGAGFVLHAKCGALQGNAIRTMWERFSTAEFLTDCEHAKTSNGDRTTARMLPRTAAQRRFDAFFAMLERAAGNSSDVPEMADPVVNVIVDLDTFLQHLRQQLDGTGAQFDPSTILERRCETTDGVAVDPHHVVALAIMGQVRRIVLDADGVIVNAGRLTRLYRGPLRAALKAIDPRCKWLGCTIRASVATIDHRQDYAKGGATNAANGWPYCHHHNLTKTKGGYQAKRHPNGWWHIHRPDGTAMKPPDAA
jgi:hypothetical protein